MKKYLIVAFLFGSAFSVCAQITLSSGSQIVVASGSNLVVTDVVNNNGTINNSGTVEISGNIENNTSGLLESSSSGTVIFNGSSAQEITGDVDAAFYGTIEIDNTAGVSIKTSTGHSQTINGTLALTNGLFTLNEFDLTLAPAATVSGYTANEYVQTNSTGQLKRTVGSSGVIFPVGNSTYNPVTLTNSGTSDVYSVVANDGLPSSFTSDNHAVNRYWDISEASGGSSNLTVQGQWSTNTTPSNEQASFARGYSCMGYTEDDGATISWGSIGSATGGSDDWLYSQSGYTQDLSTARSFFVADDYFEGYDLNLEVWLSGPYNTTNDNMDNNLNTSGGTLLIPTTDPYEGTTTVASIHADIVDWVKIELRASDRITVRKAYHAFVNTSGEIVDYSNNPFFATEVDFSLTDYSVAVIHRNHFGVASNAVDINLRTTAGTDFTQLANAFDDDITVAIPPDPLDEVDTGVYGLWSGDANANGSIVYNGVSSDRAEILTEVGGGGEMSTVISNVYNANDINLDRNVVYNGGSSDRAVILENVGGGNEMSTVLSTHLPE